MNEVKEIVGIKCSSPYCDLIFLPQELVQGLVPSHKRNNLDEVFDCTGSLRKGIEITQAQVPKVRGWSLVG